MGICSTKEADDNDFIVTSSEEDDDSEDLSDSIVSSGGEQYDMQSKADFDAADKEANADSDDEEEAVVVDKEGLNPILPQEKIEEQFDLDIDCKIDALSMNGVDKGTFMHVDVSKEEALDERRAQRKLQTKVKLAALADQSNKESVLDVDLDAKCDFHGHFDV